MCTRKYYVEERATTFLRLRFLIRAKPGKRFSLLVAAKELSGFDADGELEVPTTSVPDDVTEGHDFVVLAVKGAGKKRFVVKPEYLNSPVFLSLLEQGDEEYGFEQTGALVIPSGPEEIQKILERHGGDN